ncbi:MAG TPA: DNA polymerase III subunit delta' C-terminal domain-containing protein [Longimicrobiaceae bacterium]|nr:DNA polymerase III subunit delta' C-terminal domain-containing protein [Longimicrobiaceae bacterium]
MPLTSLRGHAHARSRLAAAVSRGTLAQSILLHGPAGIGKERFGHWLAQCLVCEAPAPDSMPCAKCLSCRLVDRLEHPDVHWFFPLPRPDASSPEKLRQKLEEERAAELMLRRENPLHVPSYDRAPAHFLGSILNLQQIAAVRPAMGRRKVFVVGDAEAMVPQESSPEAANAFLKLLEEPPDDTTIIITSANPGALLPTIISRVFSVRLLPLETLEVEDFLRDVMELDAAAAAPIAAVAQGAIGRALRLAPTGAGPGALEIHRQAGRDLLRSALGRGAGRRLAVAHKQSPAGARGDFTAELEALASWLRDLLAVASGANNQVVNADATDDLAALVQKLEIRPLSVGASIDRVAVALDMAAGNVNPQLIIADLLRGIQQDIRPAAS